MASSTLIYYSDLGGLANSSRKEVYKTNREVLKRSNYWGLIDDLQEVGLTRSSEETSNECGAKGLA